MKIGDKFRKFWQGRALRRSDRLRLKNDRLRAQGKEPLKGWQQMVDTGLGGLNKVTNQTGKGALNLDQHTDGTYNLYSETQKELARQKKKTNQQAE